MTNVVKCSVCNIVIDELLSYIQNKVSIADEETLVRICTTTFTSEEIKNSKKLLFESIPTDKRKIVRKSKGKEDRDVADIISLFKSEEPDNIPVFVARQLDKLPPILWDHLDCSKLLKDMITMKSEIEAIRTTYATLQCVNELKTEFRRLKTDSLPPATSLFKVNTKRGAWLDSGPMGLSHEYDVSTNEISTQNSLNQKSPSMQPEILRVEQNKQAEHNQNDHQRSSVERAQASAGAGNGEGGVRPIVSQESSGPTGSVVTSDTTSMTGTQLREQLTASDKAGDRCALKLSESERSSNDNTEKWQKVVYRKKQNKYRYSGKSGIARDLECTFRAADKKIPMFITNVHISATERDIINHIYNKTQERVFLEKINMKVERGHKAYKFMISESNLSIYMDESFWPEGVLFRRFVNFKHKKTNAADSASVDVLNKENNE